MLDQNWLSPSEVERRFAVMGIPNRFIDKEKEEFNSPPAVDSPSGFIGFPTPRDHSGLNILNLRSVRGTDPSKPPSFFHHPWFLEERFATVDCKPGWHVMHMHVIPESVHQPWDYANNLASQGLVPPSAIEIVLMLFLHYVGTGEQLLNKKHTWCSDQASMGRFVTVGAFGRNGLFVSAHPPDFESRGLGVCAALRNPSGRPSI